MTRNQFEEWVRENNYAARIDEGLNNIKIITDYFTRNVIIVDLKTAKTGMYKSMDTMEYDERTGIAIAYAKLNDIEIPEIEEDYELEFKRAEKGDVYYTIDTYDSNGAILEQTEAGDQYDDACAEAGNYFLTRERAEAVLNKIKTLIFLEKLHDIYCPDYKPDFNDNTYKWYVQWVYGSYKAVWMCGVYRPTDVYFATREIAENVADILNKMDSADHE